MEKTYEVIPLILQGHVVVFSLSNMLIYFLVPFPIVDGRSDGASTPPGGRGSAVYNRALH